MLVDELEIAANPYFDRIVTIEEVEHCFGEPLLIQLIAIEDSEISGPWRR